MDIHRRDIFDMKIGEKLMILDNRAQGMLTRIYNIKKACSDQKSKPAFLSDKNLLDPSVLKTIVRRFLNLSDCKSSIVPHIQPLRNEIIKSLSLYYYTFVDLLDFKDHLNHVLGVIDECKVYFDITLNTKATRLYLSLITTNIRLMILLSKVEDRKPVLGLFNLAHELVHGKSDPSFARLAQLIVDYEGGPALIKKLSEDMLPHQVVLHGALLSLANLYPRRNLNAEQWRNAQMLSLVSNANRLLDPAHTETIICEYMCLEEIESWIILGFLVSPSLISSNSTAHDLWIMALNQRWILPLFRDEIIHIHSCIQSFFESLKSGGGSFSGGMGKRIAEIKDSYQMAVNQAPLVHRDRRTFLRSALRELTLLCGDQPGLLAPKILFVLMALSFSRYEIMWLINHKENGPLRPVKQQKEKQQSEIPPLEQLLNERYLPEIMFHMEQLRCLMRKYNQVIFKYYSQYLNGYDTHELTYLLKKNGHLMNNIHETASSIIDSTLQTISSPLKCSTSDTTGIQNESHSSNNADSSNGRQSQNTDLSAIQLDWLRLQTYLGCVGEVSSLKLLSPSFNAIEFHTSLLDGETSVEQLLNECADLSLFCYHSKLFEEQFQMCLEFPAQNRYIISFPLVCAHFATSVNSELCPEEKSHIRDRSLTLTNSFLDEMAKEAKNIVSTICEEQCVLADKLLPKHSSLLISQKIEKKKRRETSKSNESSVNQLGDSNTSGSAVNKPGYESHRISREHLTTMDKLHMALTELCYAFNHLSSQTPLKVWDYSFAPREYLSNHLESRFSRALTSMIMFSPDTSEIAKPSELVTSVKAYMNVLHSIENHVNVDVIKIFNNILLQQTQQIDCNGESTITSSYTHWYSDILLRRVSSGNSHIAFSPTLSAFISLSPQAAIPFNAEEFTDPNELQALVELLGPFGTRLLCETLMWHVGSQVEELKKIVIQNRQVLLALRTNFDKPATMNELVKRLVNVDNVLQRMTIIGVILSFRSLINVAVRCQLEKRTPFLHCVIKDIKDPLINQLASAVGFDSPVDPLLLQTLSSSSPLNRGDLGGADNPGSPSASSEDYITTCLLMVFVAVTLPKLALSDASVYKAHLDGHANNIHCLALAINQIFGVMFTIGGQDDVEDRFKEFLALASASLLRLAAETSPSTMSSSNTSALKAHSNFGGSGSSLGSGGTGNNTSMLVDLGGGASGGGSVGSGSSVTSASSSSKEEIAMMKKNRDCIYILLDMIVQRSPWLSMDLLESCFPYTLLRNSYHIVHKVSSFTT